MIQPYDRAESSEFHRTLKEKVKTYILEILWPPGLYLVFTGLIVQAPKILILEYNSPQMSCRVLCNPGHCSISFLYVLKSRPDQSWRTTKHYWIEVVRSCLAVSSRTSSRSPSLCLSVGAMVSYCYLWLELSSPQYNWLNLTSPMRGIHWRHSSLVDLGLTSLEFTTIAVV